MFLSPSLISLLPGDGWENSQRGFTAQALFLKDAAFNKTPCSLCVSWLWKKKKGKEIPVSLRVSIPEDPGSDTQNNLEQFPAIRKFHIFKI